jgi:hypothetical protein
MRRALKELGHSDSAINALESRKKSSDKASGQRRAVAAAYKGMGGSGLINDEHTAALVAKGLKPSAINSFNRSVKRNAETSAERIEASMACAALYDPEETAKHMNYLHNIPEIAHNIIEANEVLSNIYNGIEGWDNSVVNICAFRTSSDPKLDRQKQEWNSFAHERGNADAFPIITEHDGTPLSQERLLALGFEHGILKCTFPTDDGGSVLPTLSKHVNNALEKELHNKFKWLPENRRLWLDAGKGGVGASRTILNKMFVDCNLPPRETVEDKEAWDEEKATWEVQTNFTFTVAYVYRKDGLPDEVKFQLDPVTHRRRKKPSGGAAATTTTTTTSNSTRVGIGCSDASGSDSDSSDSDSDEDEDEDEDEDDSDSSDSDSDSDSDEDEDEDDSESVPCNAPTVDTITDTTTINAAAATTSSTTHNTVVAPTAAATTTTTSSNTRNTIVDTITDTTAATTTTTATAAATTTTTTSSTKRHRANIPSNQWGGGGKKNKGGEGTKKKKGDSMQAYFSMGGGQKKGGGESEAGIEANSNSARISIAGPWACPDCTFHNEKMTNPQAKCEMCNYDRTLLWAKK